MIISHKHKYLFVELPYTGSTAISKELRENYAGKRILSKHSYFHEFQKIANDEEEKYFVFSCIRNPLDGAVTGYLKVKTNHQGIFTNPKYLKKNGGHVTKAALKKYKYVKDNNADFSDFLKKFYKFPYDNWSSLAHKQFDYVIKFENLQRDFRKVIELIGLEQKNPLPVVNKTIEKIHYLSYYPPEIYKHAKYVFGPFMKRWNYTFPAEWSDTSVPWSAEALFNFLGVIRKIYWRYLENSPSIYTKMILRIFGRK